MPLGEPVLVLAGLGRRRAPKLGPARPLRRGGERVLSCPPEPAAPSIEEALIYQPMAPRRQGELERFAPGPLPVPSSPWAWGARRGVQSGLYGVNPLAGISPVTGYCALDPTGYVRSPDPRAGMSRWRLGQTLVAQQPLSLTVATTKIAPTTVTTIATKASVPASLSCKDLDDLIDRCGHTAGRTYGEQTFCWGRELAEDLGVPYTGESGDAVVQLILRTADQCGVRSSGQISLPGAGAPLPPPTEEGGMIPPPAPPPATPDTFFVQEEPVVQETFLDVRKQSPAWVPYAIAAAAGVAAVAIVAVIVRRKRRKR